MQPVLHFVVNNQIITRTDTFVPVRNSRNYLYAEFEFKTEDWAGVSKIALFHNEGNEQISILLGETNTCLIPAEVLTSTSFTVSVVAGDMITANAVTIKLYESGYRTGDIPEPSQTLYEQLMTAFDEAKQTVIDSAKESESWAHGHSDYPNRDKDNAKYYSNQVVEKAKQVESSRAAVELSRQEIEDAQADVQQMRLDAQEAAEQATTSRDSAAGYAQSAEVSRTAAQEAEQNATAQVQGFDMHVTEKISEAEAAIVKERTSAVNVVKNQGESSSRDAKSAASTAISAANSASSFADNASSAKDAAEKASESVKTAATQAISDISTAKSEATQAVTSEGAKQLKSVTTAGEEKVTSMTQINTEFDTKSSQALNDLQTEKDTAVKNIKEFATEKTDEINTAGTSQKNAVNTAGDAKVKAVTDEGNKQKTAIQEAAEPFLSDINRINTMFNLLAYTDKVYSIDIPLWETTQGSAGIKSDDNAGLIALPSTAAEHRQNDYEELPWFKTIDANAIVDDNGIKKITAVKGDDNFSETGSADVFVCGLAFYEKWSDLGNGYMRYSRCFTPREGYELNKLAYNLDGTKNPFFLIAKYPLVKGEDGLLHSQPNKRCAFRTSDSATEAISMNDSITHMKKRGKYYSLATFLDNGYIQTTWLLMFGDINSDKTMTGCTGNSFQFVASVESDELHTYFPVTNSQASSIEVGSYVSVGHEYMSGSSRSNDRYDKRIHEIAFDVKVLKIETLDDNNKAVYLDCDAFSTTHQESGDTQLRCIMSSMHWRTGFNKDVKGRTGSPCPTVAGLTNRRYPIVFQGIEMQLGIYEIMSGFSIITGDNTCEIYGLADATKAVTGPKQNQAGYIKLSEINITSKNAWNYITHLNFSNGYLCAASCGESGSGSSKGCGDAVYPTGNTGETRELLSFGSIWHRDTCGLFCLYLNGGLGSCWWNFGGRLSVNAVLQEG